VIVILYGRWRLNVTIVLYLLVLLFIIIADYVKLPFVQNVFIRISPQIKDFWFEIDSIESAEEIRNAEICIPETETVALEEGEFYDWELVDCKVETVEGKTIGIVKELMRTGGTEILVVAGEEKDFLIPFAETICTEVDIENKLIRVDAPEGLLDF
jgi:16S rRNA processing protein RimM